MINIYDKFGDVKSLALDNDMQSDAGDHTLVQPKIEIIK